MFYGLTPLGVIHTAISLIAVAAGLIALGQPCRCGDCAPGEFRLNRKPQR